MRSALYSWFERLNIVKMSILPKLSCRINEISIKLPSRVFIEVDKLIIKIFRKDTSPRLTKAFFEKKNKVGNITLLVLTLTI